MELLSPAGNFEKLEAALRFGADAVYLAGKKYGLRAASDNFDLDELKAAAETVHSLGRKVYVTLNIYARDTDFDGLCDYAAYLHKIGVDAAIVSDVGVLNVLRNKVPELSIHVSTQASVTNSFAASFFADMGVKRIVLARELSIDEIKRIRDGLSASVELEVFAHGAMCISYSGRCLMSDFLAGRHANLGECFQSCRWEYAVAEKTRGEYMPIVEDDRGTYIFNSKDLNLISYIPELAKAGVHSLKIEGRVKSSYYVASVTNAYRRAIDIYEKGGEYILPQSVLDCLEKTSHRRFTSGFTFSDKEKQCYDSAKPVCDYDFCGIVLGANKGKAEVEMRGRFKKGDELEVLSPSGIDGKPFIVGKMTDGDGNVIVDAMKVQQRLFLDTDLPLSKGDMLRKKKTST